MLACLERSHRGGVMQVRRKADVDRVNLRIFQQFGDVPVFPNIREIECSSRSPEIALDIAEVACKLLFVFTINGSQLRFADVFPRLNVSAAHEPEAKHGNTHRHGYPNACREPDSRVTYLRLET